MIEHSGTQARLSAGGTGRVEPAGLEHAFAHLPLALWQADFTELDQVFDRLRSEGVSDLAAHAARHADFLDWAVAAVRITAVNDKAADTFSGRTAGNGVGEPVGHLCAGDPGLFLRCLCAHFSGAPSFAEHTDMRDGSGWLVPIAFSVVFPHVGNAFHIATLSASPVADRIVERSTETEDAYRSVFLNVPVPLVRLDLSENMRFLDEIRDELQGAFLHHVEHDAGFAFRYIEMIRLREGNLAAARLFGLRSPDLFPTSVARVWQTSPDTVRRACLARLHGERGYSEETRIHTHDGGVKDVLFSVVFTQTSAPASSNVAAFIDISDRVRAEAALQSLQTDFAHASRLTLVGELGGSIAHEVNQPLTAIIATGELIQRSLDRAPPDLNFIRGLACDVVEDGQRATDIVSRIRAMVSKKPPHHRSSSLNDVVADAVAFLQRECRSSEVELTFAPTPDLPPVVIDRVQIQQVLVNLAMNAIQALERGNSGARQVHIVTERGEGAEISVVVSDTGPGVDPEVATTIFDSFVTTREGGLGIGLAICRSIMEAHGGRIELADCAAGAAFRFSLPVPVADEAG